MNEKLELWEMSLPKEDLLRLNDHAKAMSEVSGIKTSASDVFRGILAMVIDRPEKLVRVLNNRIMGALNDESNS